MNQCDPINAVAQAVHDAAARLDVPAYRILEQRIELWQQSWPSTACGYGGVGGAAITRADTVVIKLSQAMGTPPVGGLVYIAQQFAYAVTPDAAGAAALIQPVAGRADMQNSPAFVDLRRPAEYVAPEPPHDHVKRIRTVQNRRNCTLTVARDLLVRFDWDVEKACSA